MMSRLLWHGCWSLFESILGLVIVGSPGCFSVKGIEWVLIERIAFGVERD